MTAQAPNSAPPPAGDQEAGPRNGLSGALTAPFALAGRAALTVAWFPLRNIGKKIPLG